MMLVRLRRAFFSKTFLLYAVIGASGVAIDFLLYALLVYIGIPPVFASVISIFFAIANNFFWNLKYNFKSKGRFVRRLLLFYGVGVVGMVCSALIIYGLHDIAGVGAFLAKLISIPPVVAMQYIANRMITFRHGQIHISWLVIDTLLLRLCAIVLGLFTLLAILFTTQTWWTAWVFQQVNNIGEIVLAAGVGCAICIFLAFLFMRVHWTENMSRRLLWIIISVYAFVGVVYICLIIGRVVYVADSQVILNTTNDGFLNEYVQSFPYQIPYVLFVRALERLFGEQGLMLALYIINLFSVTVIIYVVHNITKMIFKNPTVTVLATLCVASMGALLYYIPFVYGDMPGIACFLAGCLVLFRYTDRSHGSAYPLLGTSLVLFVAAIVLKSSLLVPVVAIYLGVLYWMFRKRSATRIAVPGAVLISVVIGSSLIQAGAVRMYESVYHPIDSSREIPKTAWVAMGLQSGSQKMKPDDRFYPSYAKEVSSIDLEAPGVWNSFIYAGTAYDTNKLNDVSLDYIRESTISFASHPLYALQFFMYKAAYVWADPLYDTHMQTYDNGSHVGVSRWAGVRVDQTGALIKVLNSQKSPVRWIFVAVNDAMQTLLYLFAVISLMTVTRKKMTMGNGGAIVAIVCCTLAGVVLYTFWEAAPRYVLPYVLLLVPLSAYGAYESVNWYKTRIR